MNNECEWSLEEEDYGYWDSDCGYVFTFNDGGPISNGFKYCPKCGKELKESEGTVEATE